MADEEAGKFMCSTKEQNSKLQECSIYCPSECLDEFTYRCNGMCFPVAAPCNGECQDGMEFCDGKCQKENLMCNGECPDEWYKTCDETCSADEEKESINCNGNCISITQQCNGECQKGCVQNTLNFLAARDILNFGSYY